MNLKFLATETHISRPVAWGGHGALPHTVDGSQMRQASRLESRAYDSNQISRSHREVLANLGRSQVKFDPAKSLKTVAP